MSDLPFPSNAIYLKVDEAAQICRNNPKTIRRWISAGTLPATRVGRNWLIARADLKALLAANGKRSLANVL